MNDHIARCSLIKVLNRFLSKCSETPLQWLVSLHHRQMKTQCSLVSLLQVLIETRRVYGLKVSNSESQEACSRSNKHSEECVYQESDIKESGADRALYSLRKMAPAPGKTGHLERTAAEPRDEVRLPHQLLSSL
jgi:hypothetical protein